MNFGAVLEILSEFFEENGVLYAVVGGVAIAAYGLPRTTVDLDFAVESRAQDDLVRFLESRGYETLHRSTGYSNHKHPDPDWDQLDFIYVKDETSRQLFTSCRLLPGPGGRQMPVPRPEHLVAMKVAAMKNDPGRTFQEMTDIRFLLQLPGIDRAMAASYFDRHGLRDRLDEIEQTL